MDTHLHGRSTTWLSSTTAAAAAHFNIWKAAGCFVRTVNILIFSLNICSQVKLELGMKKDLGFSLITLFSWGHHQLEPLSGHTWTQAVTIGAQIVQRPSELGRGDICMRGQPRGFLEQQDLSCFSNFLEVSGLILCVCDIFKANDSWISWHGGRCRHTCSTKQYVQLKFVDTWTFS